MWCDEPHIASSLDSKASITDFFVTYPEIDRLLIFAIHQFTSFTPAISSGLIVTGPRFSGKTTVIRVILINFNKKI